MALPLKTEWNATKGYKSPTKDVTRAVIAGDADRPGHQWWLPEYMDTHTPKASTTPGISGPVWDLNEMIGLNKQHGTSFPKPKEGSWFDDFLNTAIQTIVVAGIGYGVGSGAGLWGSPNAVAGPAPGPVAGEGSVLNGGFSGGAGTSEALGGLTGGTAPVDYAAANTALTAPSAANYPEMYEALMAGGKTGGGIMNTVGNVVGGAAKWINANPIPTLIGGQMLMNAFTPDELDVMAEKRKLQQEDLDRANANVSGVRGLPSLKYTGKSPYPDAPPEFLQNPPGLMSKRPA